MPKENRSCKVEDAMPPEGDYVLAFDANDSKRELYGDNDWFIAKPHLANPGAYGDMIWRQRQSECVERDLWCVTHWQPLPDEPERD